MTFDNHDVGDNDANNVNSSSKTANTLPLHLLPNRDDDGTHNSSISSWSADGGQHMAYSVPSVPPTVLEWKSPANEDDMDMEDIGDAAQDVHAKLFMENDEYGDDDENLSDTVGRTRLNFNLVLSPDQDGPGASSLKDSKQGMI